MSIRCRRCRACKPARGFTLVELVITLVVLGILAAVALPSFMDSIRKGRRADAYAAVAAVQQAQERWRSNHAQYTTSLSDLALGSTSSSGYYTIELASSGASGDTLASAYVVTARGNRGSSQASDGQCRNLSMRLRGGNLEYAGCGSCEDFSYAVSNACWPR
ncbi:type IV pilin protein [Rubrivivax gelatinosus]|uniref:Type IV pilus assembly protein PilE n=1 Tax=Rubrivivax gelatinosus TaxID=28068 RepID=A0A4R2LWD4_RUBGE|nr:type IV pilin protein [Rubrivivax gelatinosus]MBK1689253.1 pilus assembly protein [Rubrivivax gelatinosus]TCO98411.1 type IV pilus assembly protein PilE [Rubrivivax gelatinosus]